MKLVEKLKEQSKRESAKNKNDQQLDMQDFYSGNTP